MASWQCKSWGDFAIEIHWRLHEESQDFDRSKEVQVLYNSLQFSPFLLLCGSVTKVTRFHKKQPQHLSRELDGDKKRQEEHNKTMDYPGIIQLIATAISCSQEKPWLPNTPTATQNVAEILVILDPAAWSKFKQVMIGWIRTDFFLLSMTIPIIVITGLVSWISSTKKLVICYLWVFASSSSSFMIFGQHYSSESFWGCTQVPHLMKYYLVNIEIFRMLMG